MNISQKLAIALSLFVILSIISGVIGIGYTNLVKNRINAIVEQTAPTVENINALIEILWKTNAIINQFRIASTHQELEDLKDDYEKLTRDFLDEQKKLLSRITDETIRANLEAAAKRQRQMNRDANDLVGLRKIYFLNPPLTPGDDLGSRIPQLTAAIKGNLTESTIILSEVKAKLSTLNQDANKASLTAIKTSTTILITITVLAILAAIAIITYLTRNLITPINELSSAVESISKGNLKVEVRNPQTNDELEKLTQTFNQMTLSLRQMLEESPRLKKFLKIQHPKESEIQVEPGNFYIMKEKDPHFSFQLLLQKIQQGWSPLALVRTQPPIIHEKYGIPSSQLIWISDTKEKNILALSELNQMLKTVIAHLEKHEKPILFIERPDYLMALFGISPVAAMLSKMKDHIISRKGLGILSLDPSILAHHDLAILEKELMILPSHSSVEASEDLQAILGFIKDRKRLNLQTSFKDIGRNFSITAPTVQKKLLELERLGLIRILKYGRNKILEPV